VSARRWLTVTILSGLTALAAGAPAVAADAPTEVRTVIENNRFIPAETRVKAGTGSFVRALAGDLQGEFRNLT
jgi:hypothetical protein